MVFSPPDEHGNRKRLEPTLAERLTAARAIADKLLPSLKAAEVSGIPSNDVNITLGQGEREASPRDTAKAIMLLLSKGYERQAAENSAQPEPSSGLPTVGNTTPSRLPTDGTPRADPEDRLRFPTDGNPTPDLQETFPEVAPEILPSVGQNFMVADGAARITCTEILADARAKWVVTDCNGMVHYFAMSMAEAEQWAVRKAAEGKLPRPRSGDTK